MNKDNLNLKNTNEELKNKIIEIFKLMAEYQNKKSS